MKKMIKFSFGNVELRTKKDAFEKLLETIYLQNYKKDKLKHLSRNDKRIPTLKITGDIFSVPLYFKDRSGKEIRLFIDGEILFSEIKIHTLTLDNHTLDPNEHHELLEILKSLTLVCDGYILISSNNVPARIINGRLEKFHILLTELFNAIPESEKDDIYDIYEWLKNCSPKFE